MNRLFLYLRPYRKALLGASTASITNKIFDMMPPLMVAWIIDTLEGQSPAWARQIIGSEDPWTLSIYLCSLIVVVFGLESFFEWVYKRGFMSLAQDLQHDLRMEAYEKLQQREIAYFERNRVGNLMAMLNDDINQLERFLNDSFNQILQLVTLFIFAMAAIVAFSWEVALMGLAAVPVLIVGSIYYQSAIGPYYKKIRQWVGELSTRLENNISGILVVKSFVAETYEARRVEKVSDAYRQANVDAIKLNALIIPILRMVISLAFAGMMLMGAYWHIQGDPRFTLGAMAFFAMMIQRLLWPMTILGRVFDEYERAKASAERIFSLVDSESELQVTSKQNAELPTRLSGDISFDKVAFAYRESQTILQNLSFEVKAGQSIGIAGSTGAGKTTLIKLLLRLYDASQGQIRFDGQDIKRFPLAVLRKNIALVSQDTYLFQGSIAENIAYGREDATPAEIRYAAQQAQIDDFVESLPEGYDALVGERGIRLSGGQRQRISIARAILKDAPILILDEATSAVDSETERAIQENLNRLIEGRTALIIAHRLSTIRHTDQIWVMEQGEIVEQGSHESLLAMEGIYKDLWGVQVGLGSGRTY